MAELSAGTDPNSSSNASIINDQEPGYGCGGTRPNRARGRPVRRGFARARGSFCGDGEAARETRRAPHMNRGSLLIGSLIAAACVLSSCSSDPPLEVAPSVNLSQLQGKWYEIAKLPRATEVDCHGTTAFYTQAADGSLSLVNQCNVGSASGKLQTVAMTATVPDRPCPPSSRSMSAATPVTTGS